jgi:hypothetical protein
MSDTNDQISEVDKEAQTAPGGVAEAVQAKQKGLITELTPEQEAAIPGFVEKYTQIGLKTGPIDREKAKAYAAKLYKFLNREPPKVIFTDGPTQAWLATVWVNHLQQENAVPENVENIVFDWEKIKVIAKNVAFVWPYLDGQMMAPWGCWVKYMKYIGVEVTQDFSLIEDQIEFNVIYPLHGYCIFSERFSQVHMKDGKLHCDGGPSVEYPDGTRVWTLNGITVPQWLAETPEEEIDCFEFTKIINAEVRREFLRKVGVEIFCEKMGSEVIDKDDDYELHLIDLGGTTKKWPYLKMLNPSVGCWHMECVAKECKTVKEALTFRNQSKLKPIVLT